jgi:hypothetical protein
MGIEARKGGRVIAVDNVITNNQFHGVAIGPRGSAILERNLIENNNITTFPPKLAHIAAYPTSPLFTSPNMLKSSICLQPIRFIQPLPPVQSG